MLRRRAVPVVLCQCGAELRHLVPANCESGRQGVAAVALEIIRAGAQCVKQVEISIAAAGALAHLSIDADHDAGQAELFSQARGGYTDDALVPTLAGEHYGAVGRIAAQQFVRFGPYAVLELLAFAVHVAQLLRVYARREREADGRGRDTLGAAAALVHKRFHARARAVFHLFKAASDYIPVLSGQRHDVGHRADADEVGIAL